jgi:hypothetical protein
MFLPQVVEVRDLRRRYHREPVRLRRQNVRVNTTIHPIKIVQ